MSEELLARPKTLVGVFGQQNHVEKALEQLSSARFHEEQVGVTMRGLQVDETE